MWAIVCEITGFRLYIPLHLLKDLTTITFWCTYKDYKSISKNAFSLQSYHRRQPQYFIYSFFLPLQSIHVLTVAKFDWQNLVAMNMHEAGETNLLPMKSHVTIKYSSKTMTSYWDCHTLKRNQRTLNGKPKLIKRNFIG